jgi:ATP adenylyltransferase
MLWSRNTSCSFLKVRQSYIPKDCSDNPLPAQQPQSSPPTPHQLLIAYNTLLVASQHPSEPRRLLAFYNGGTGAGASQSWRHLQCVQVPERLGAPVDSWMRGIKPPGRQNEAFAHPKLPYLHLVYPLPAAQERGFPPTEEEDEQMMHVLTKGMMSLLDDMVDAVRRNHGRQDGGWNLLMTLYANRGWHEGQNLILPLLVITCT